MEDDLPTAGTIIPWLGSWAVYVVKGSYSMQSALCDFSTVTGT